MSHKQRELEIPQLSYSSITKPSYSEVVGKINFICIPKKNHIVSNDNNPDESDNKEGGQPGWMITITQTQQSSFEKEYRTQPVSKTEVAVGIAEKIYFLNTRALNKFGW